MGRRPEVLRCIDGTDVTQGIRQCKYPGLSVRFLPTGRDNGCIVDQDLVLGSASGRGLELQRLPAVVDTGLGAVSTVLLLLAIGHSLAVMAAVLFPKTVLKVGLDGRARSRRSSL